jgi:hypothetical protein
LDESQKHELIFEILKNQVDNLPPAVEVQPHKREAGKSQEVHGRIPKRTLLSSIDNVIEEEKIRPQRRALIRAS